MTSVAALRTNWIRSRTIFFAMSLFLCVAASSQSVSAAAPSITERSPSLHVEIDRLLRADTLAPPSAKSDDGEFLRRATLDLHGIIPTADETRAFLDDKSADKRERLIDRLLASPRYARHMATTFDVLWLERRTDKVVKFQTWYDYLYDSFLADKPYDQLVREVLAADETQECGKATAKFYHNRTIEPNALTRDIGRLFFGMDMQCNQCHNHPVIDDYKIADYYGLSAFVSRTYLFNNKKTKLQELGEKADGEVSYTSVFTGESAEGVPPRLPRDAALPPEPKFKKGEELEPKAAKDDKPIPKYSRRALLAEQATDGSYDLLYRNAVNRLWAHLFGRGLVHPVDLIHPDNPPSHPAVLDLLSRHFREHGCSVKHMLRELMLSDAYGRSCELPSPKGLNATTAEKRLNYCRGNLVKQQSLLTKAEAVAEAVRGPLGKLEAAAKKDPKSIEPQQLAEAAAKRDAAVDEVRRIKTLVNATTKSVEEAERVVEYLKLAASDPQLASQKWEQLVLFWSDRTDVALLKPLPPEAFTDSLMQAAGVVATAEAKARASLKSKPPKEMTEAKPQEKPAIEAMLLDKQTFEPLRTNFTQFVNLYADAPGQDFAATVNQALFFGNAGMVETWLKPAGTNLTARLAELKDAQALADEMYLTVLTRRPTKSEYADVATFLKGREKDRPAAVQEMVWALMSSNEFRFNH